MPNDDHREYLVVVNHEEQYSIWPASRKLPAGWRAAGSPDSKENCLAHIDQVWTDMRPLSLRMVTNAGSASAPAPRKRAAEG
jgi:MbtH protein